MFVTNISNLCLMLTDTLTQETPLILVKGDQALVPMQN